MKRKRPSSPFTARLLALEWNPKAILLIIQSFVWVTRQDFIVHSQSHSLDRQQLGKFLKSNLVFDLFHGYKDLAGQSSWWTILFCVYVYIHWSKAVALFAQFLSSLPERNSTNERRPWQNYMPRVQETVSDFWKWKSQRTSNQFSNKQFARCLGDQRVQYSQRQMQKLRETKRPDLILLPVLFLLVWRMYCRT